MFCPECGKSMQTDDLFCRYCGFRRNEEKLAEEQVRPPADQPAVAPPIRQYTQQPEGQPPHVQLPHAQPPHVQPAYAQAGPPGAVHGQAGNDQPKKKGKGCLIALAIVLVIIGVLAFFLFRMFWGPPKDLGIRYTQVDFDQAMEKVELTVDFEGMDSDELTEFISENRGEKLMIDDYDWEFSDYRQREFELTPEEATAFANEVAPLFTWLDRVQILARPDGSTEGSYQVDFDKVKAEIIPDVADQIPPVIDRVLPGRFNLYTRGSYEIQDNNIIVPQQLETLNVGAASLHPLIGEISQNERDMVFSYVERIYRQIPGLIIHYLRVNERGNFEVSVYGPTRVRVTSKPGR